MSAAGSMPYNMWGGMPQPQAGEKKLFAPDPRFTLFVVFGAPANLSVGLCYFSHRFKRYTKFRQTEAAVWPNPS
jgi:hypothetical protein